MQTKHDASLDFFSFLMQMLFYKDADARCPYDADVSFQKCNFHDADVPCRGADAEFIHDGASAHIYTMMQMSPCRYAMMQMTPCWYAMMQMF